MSKLFALALEVGGRARPRQNLAGDRVGLRDTAAIRYSLAVSFSPKRRQRRPRW